MKPRHQVSRAAIELIKRFEGYRRKAAQLPDGRWTIGYGHLRTAREGAAVSEADAEALLIYDLIGVAQAVDELAYADLNQNQFDALCAFAFSIGPDAFRGSDVLKRVNEGAFTQAAFALELWRRAEFEGERIIIDALVRRRAAEKLLFLTPAGGAWRPAPSALLRPELDTDAPQTAPRGNPVRVAAWLDGDAVRLAREEAPAAETASPIKAAAAAVGARLQALFSESDAASRAEAGSAPEPVPAAEAPPAPAAADTAEPAATPATASADEAAAEPAPASGTPQEPARRILIDDTAPYEFIPAPVQPIGDDGDGMLGVVSLIVIGLAFLAGGVFWALTGPSGVQTGVFTPLLVGWLAGVAGVGFVSAAIFMLLQRVTRAAERRSRR